MTTSSAPTKSDRIVAAIPWEGDLPVQLQFRLKKDSESEVIDDLMCMTGGACPEDHYHFCAARDRELERHFRIRTKLHSGVLIFNFLYSLRLEMDTNELKFYFEEFHADKYQIIDAHVLGRIRTDYPPERIEKLGRLLGSKYEGKDGRMLYENCENFILSFTQHLMMTHPAVRFENQILPIITVVFGVATLLATIKL